MKRWGGEGWGDSVTRSSNAHTNVPRLGVADAHGLVGPEGVEISGIYACARVEFAAAMIDGVDGVKGLAFSAFIVPRKPDLARHGLHAAVVGPSAEGRKRELLLLFGVGDVEEEGKGEEEEKRRAADGGLHACLPSFWSRL